MVTFAESEVARLDYLARLAALEDGAVRDLLAAYVKTLARIEAVVTDALAANTPLGGALLKTFAGAEDTATISVLRGRADYIIEQLERFGVDARRMMREVAPTAARLGIASAADDLQGIAATLTRPNRQSIEAILARTSAATNLRAYFAEFARTMTQQAIDTLVVGVVLGKAPDAIVRSMRDTMNLGRNRLRTMVRTEVMTAHREGKYEFMQSNRRLLKGWIWNAALDARTCQVCWAMNGTLHPLDEMMSSHPNCRCRQTLVPKTLDELRAERGEAPLGVDGPQIEPFDSNEAFRRTLTQEQQIKVLGPGKYALWSDGRITLQDLVARTESARWGPGLRAVTLRELRARGIEPAPVLERVARRRRRS